VQATDPFNDRYEDLLDGTYDCVDRIVLNGYFRFIQSSGGFRTWWRQLFGDDDNLDNAHLIRFAGRFARRVRCAAQQKGIPVIVKKPDDRMHEIAEELRPTDPKFKGVFCITVHRAPNSVWGVTDCGRGGPHLERKAPKPYVNHYAFHIVDPEWGHVTIKVCPHPPFNIQVILNGHEYVANRATKKNVSFTKEGNCFTNSSNLADLSKVAVTSCSSSAKGRLKQVCERWLYSACLCYLLPLAEQQRTRMRYDWSVYQMEYSRNFLFSVGRIMEEVFQSVIDRTRRALDVRTIRTIFGRKHRPHRRRQGKQPRLEVEVERPTYDLTVFKVHFGLLMLKIYTKGERVLRVEATVHNAKKEFARYGLEYFDEIADALRQMVQRFLEVLRSVDACWVTDETLESLPEPSQVGASRLAGVDLNRKRIRTVMMAVVALSIDSRGFRVEQVAERVGQTLGQPYTSRQASYDLKKMRGKGLVEKLTGTRRYVCPADGLRTIMSAVVLRERVIKPILSGTVTRRRGRPPKSQDPLDRYYRALRETMEQLFHELGLAA
jgi:hypothetical protein